MKFPLFFLIAILAPILWVGLVAEATERNPLVTVAPPQKRAYHLTRVQVKNVRVDPFLKLKKTTTTMAMNTENNVLKQTVYSSMKIDTDAPVKKSFGIVLQSGVSAKLYDKQDGSREKSADFLVSPSYQVTENYKFTALVTGSYDLNKESDSDLGKGQLIVSRSPFELISTTNVLKSWKFSPNLTLNLPANKGVRESSYLVGVKPGITIAPSAEMLGSKRWDTTFNLTVSRNFHSFETAPSGSSNTPYASAQTVTLGYSFPHDIRMDLSATHYNTWTYANTAGEYFTHSQEVSVNFLDGFNWGVGHYYGNPWVNIYGPDGQTSNFGLVTEKYSYVYSNLTYVY